MMMNAQWQRPPPPVVWAAGGPMGAPYPPFQGGARPLPIFPFPVNGNPYLGRQPPSQPPPPPRR
jgi:hypothetical protein